MKPTMTLAERASALGVSPRELVTLSQRDRRITAAVAMATDGAIARLRRWIELDMPDAHRETTAILADPSIERGVRDALAMLPEPVALHVVECVLFVGSGIETHGFCVSSSISWPHPEHDSMHLISLASGDIGLIAHEIGHSWAASLKPDRPAQTVASAKQAERTFYKAVADVGGQADYERIYLRKERHADELARLWTGQHFNSCGSWRRAELASKLDNASEEQPR